MTVLLQTYVTELQHRRLRSSETSRRWFPDTTGVQLEQDPILRPFATAGGTLSTTPHQCLPQGVEAPH
jgi:hypothetical protein